MLLFDWKKIYEETNGSPKEIIRVFRMLTENRIPQNKYDKIYRYYQQNFKGESFLVHPERLLYNGYRFTYKEMAVYIAFASIRPLADYLATHKISLDPFVVSTNLLQFTDNNRLLKYEDEEIHFRYEGSPPTKEIH